MGRTFVVAGVLAGLFASVGYADLSQVICQDDRDNGIVMNDLNLLNPVKDQAGEYNIGWSCAQNFGPGHVFGDFITPENNPDPTINIVETVTNDTAFAWTGYTFTIAMTKPFTVMAVTKPSGWSVSPVVPPSFAAAAGQLPNNLGSGYVATVVFTGPAIAVNGEADFGVKVSFSGSTQFCTEQTPTPEPMSLALLGIGSLLLRRVRR